MVGNSEGATGDPLGQRLRRLAVDLTPLRTSSGFRALWFGELVSGTGTQITLVALYVQVYALTGSPFAVGAIGLAQLLPLVVVTLGTGPLIDSHDRRQLLILSQLGLAVASVLLLVGALRGNPPLGLLYVAAGLSAGFHGFALSTRIAVTPGLVGPEMFPSAAALNQLGWNASHIVGPALGGILVAQFGYSWAYGVDVASFAAAFVAAAVLPRLVPTGAERPPDGLRGTWSSLGEGWRYLWARPVLLSAFGVDLVAMVFGMPRSLFPVLAVERYSGNAETVGFLFSALAVGAVLGALTSGWVRRVVHPGRAVLWSVAVWGAAIVVFGFSGTSFALALIALALAGAADVVSAVFRGTIVQLGIPDDLRGRMSSLHILNVTGGPRLGDVEAGIVATLTTPTISVVSGGLLCIAGVAAAAVFVPSFTKYRAGEPL